MLFKKVLERFSFEYRKTKTKVITPALSSKLESDLKMSESHANVVSFDENVSTLSNM